MVYQINLQNLKLPKFSIDYLEKEAKRLDRYLPDFAVDLSLLHIFISFHKTKGYFDGSITLHLPRQALNVHFRSSLIDQAIKSGFAKLRRELKEYKGRHFMGDSEYPRRLEAWGENGY